MLLTENGTFREQYLEQVSQWRRAAWPDPKGGAGLASVTDAHQSQRQPTYTFILSSNLWSFKIKKEQVVNCK